MLIRFAQDIFRLIRADDRVSSLSTMVSQFHLHRFTFVLSHQWFTDKSESWFGFCFYAIIRLPSINMKSHVSRIEQLDYRYLIVHDGILTQEVM